MNLSEARKCVIAVTSFEATNSFFNTTQENKFFSITTYERQIPEGEEELIDKLIELLELRSQKYFEFHVREVEKRGSRREIENSRYILAGFVHFKCELLAQFEKSKI